MQGIFITSQNSFGYEGVTVAHNAIDGALWNGIWVDHATGVNVTGNVIQHYKDQPPRLVYSNVYGSITNNIIGTSVVTEGVNRVNYSGNSTIAPIDVPSVGSFVSLMASFQHAGSVSPLSSTYVLPHLPMAMALVAHT